MSFVSFSRNRYHNSTNLARMWINKMKPCKTSFKKKKISYKIETIPPSFGC